MRAVVSANIATIDITVDAAVTRAVISAFYDSDVEAHTGTESSAHGEHNSYSF